MQRVRDSNPRRPFDLTHFPGVLLQPLGQLSVNYRCKYKPLKSEIPHKKNSDYPKTFLENKSLSLKLFFGTETGVNFGILKL